MLLIFAISDLQFSISIRSRCTIATKKKAEQLARANELANECKYS